MPPSANHSFLKKTVSSVNEGGAVAFSLIELLTVMALVSLLTMAALPALRVMDGINVSGAASMAESEISLARQTAMSRNLPVELRIYKYDDGSGEAWRVLATVIPASLSGAASDEWISPGRVLPGHIVIEDTKNYSTIVSKAASPSGSKVAPWTGQESSEAPSLVRNKSYVGFLFQANGSTDLPSDQAWCLTLKNPRSQPSQDKPSDNFVSLVIDSATGRTVSYQP